jgi:hypothetical protein
MGRALIGNRPMTAAERQRRHRAGLTAKSAVAKRAKRKPAASHRPKRRLRKCAAQRPLVTRAPMCAARHRTTTTDPVRAACGRAPLSKNYDSGTGP